MSASKPLQKAKLTELTADLKNTKSGGKSTTVQFNPESLKVTYANSVANNKPGQDDQKGTPSMLYIGAGTMKLTMTLWFDATAPVPPGALPDNSTTADDVGLLTQEVTYFITPQAVPGSDNFLPVPLSFTWGSFSFSGLMDSIDESIEYFSPDGKPLRASMNLSISQQKIQIAPVTSTGNGLPSLPGIRPMVPSIAGQSLQAMAAAAGVGGNWQSIATANGIENPRLLQPGTLIDLNASLTTS